jgi:hypothetical protein
VRAGRYHSPPPDRKSVPWRRAQSVVHATNRPAGRDFGCPDFGSISRSDSRAAQPVGLAMENAGTRQSAKATLLHMDVRMLRAQDAQEQPFAGGRRSDV